jgi:uncharacterized membrane protein HdeD (DUF308 family)
MTTTTHLGDPVHRQSAESTNRHWAWHLVQGILLVLAGLLALIFPVVSTVTVTLVIGWVLIFSGIFQAISLIRGRDSPLFWLPLVSVVLFLLMGALILRNPAEGVLTLTLLMIVFFMVEGMAKIIFALAMRPLPNWGWVLLSGLIAVALSLFLWVRLPVTALWLIGVFVGIELIAEGIAISAIAWRMRRA